MSDQLASYAAGLAELANRLGVGTAAFLEELRKAGDAAPSAPPVIVAPAPAIISPAMLDEHFNRTLLFDGLRAIYGAFDNNEVAAIDRAIDRALGKIVLPPQIGISAEAFNAAAVALEPDNLLHARAAIRAVDEVESGSGWFTDVRASILALDGPGGFLDGPNLPKILYEAHVFARNTGGKFNASHPNLSSAKWNKALYVGGQGEYERLYRAMQLNKDAALMAASWGRYQILGENFKAAGFSSVEAFVDAMKESEERHLEAFVSFVKSANLVAAFRKISTDPAACAPFARGYNGSGYAANNYHGKIAAAFGRWLAKLRS